MTSPPFILEERLARGGEPIATLPLCVVLLKHDARWPWLILVPQRASLTEMHDLAGPDALQLMREIHAASSAVANETGVEKVNVAALGNIVRQLHIHIVGRWSGDPCWPEPVFGLPGKTAYSAEELVSRAARLQAHLHSHLKLIMEAEKAP
jgi:diadenosine tetraphosphate (Ap4A) HIT family hydrolase